MHFFFEQLASRIAAPFVSERPRNGKLWQCRCGQPVFFRNSQCLACLAALGYEPEQGQLSSLQPGPLAATWLLDAAPQAGLWRRCANLDTPAACNWLLADDGQASHCIACRLNNTIPDLSITENHERWRKVEIAKRRLIAQLLNLGLPVIAKADDEEQGLAFDFLGVDQKGRAPVTGHANGLVTLDIKEADDAYRETVRVQMREPYRTLLGHFRHEVGHYYWDRLIAESHWLEPFRQLFGDERVSYAEALERHYAQGAPDDWSQRCVSAYATMHPWEDWAETWAHYLHMLDTLETAHACGLSLKPAKADEPALDGVTLPTRVDTFDDTISDWFALTYVLNSLNRSIGMPDSYPFKLSTPVLEKLAFVHKVVASYKTSGIRAARPAAAPLPASGAVATPVQTG